MRIVFSDESIISVGSGSGLTINEYVYRPEEQVRSSTLRLLYGKVKSFVKDLTGYRKQKFNVTTDTAVIGVRGTVFLVWVEGELTQVACFESEISVQSMYDPTQIITVTPNMMTEITTGRAPSSQFQITPDALNRLNQGLISSDTGNRPPAPPTPKFAPPPTGGSRNRRG